MTIRGEADKQETRAAHTGATRALSLDLYSFNFSVSTAQRVRAYGGPPAHVLRLRGMEDEQERYYGDMAEQYEVLWLAAAAGSIDEQGIAVRQTLLSADGRDHLGELQRARRLFREGRDAELERCEAFNRGWLRHLDLDFSGCAQFAARMDAFNEVFPIEADLPIDPKSGEYMWMGKPWQPLEPPSREELLERFPLRQAAR
jgi:hypothetical protein